MPSASSRAQTPVLLVWGDDEFSVKQRSKEVFQRWSAEPGGMETEIIDAAAVNGFDAMKALARLREALQTLPFFARRKAIWFQGCNFLADERAAGAQAVSESVSALALELKAFEWSNVRLLVSAAKVDKRKSIYKTIEKIGTVETFAAPSIDDRDWGSRAEAIVRNQLNSLGKTASEEVVSEVAGRVGPDVRQLANEVDKLALYAGERKEIRTEDVAAVVTRNRQARAFALGDALGDRDLPRLLRCLDQELWEMKFDSQKSEIGLLYGLIAKVRSLIFLGEMLRLGWLKQEPDYGRFKARLERVPADALPGDKRFNPLAMNPYVLFKALPQAGNYSREELIQAMDLLLRCNRELVLSGLDEALVLQRALVRIAARPAQQP
jgi:DNA polymerase-3 subunit delta